MRRECITNHPHRSWRLAITTAVKLDRAHCVETIISLSGLRSFELDKESESRLLQAFNSLVPRGTYLADYLDGAAEAFESAIRSDIVMPFASSIRETRRELDESAKALAAIKLQIKAEEEKLRAIRRDVDYAKRQAAELSECVDGVDDAIRAICRVAREVNSKSK